MSSFNVGARPFVPASPAAIATGDEEPMQVEAGGEMWDAPFYPQYVPQQYARDAPGAQMNVFQYLEKQFLSLPIPESWSHAHGLDAVARPPNEFFDLEAMAQHAAVLRNAKTVFGVHVSHRCFGGRYGYSAVNPVYKAGDKVIVSVDRGYHLGVVTDNLPSGRSLPFKDAGVVLGFASEQAQEFYEAYSRPFELRLLEVMSMLTDDQAQTNISDAKMLDAELNLDHRKCTLFFRPHPNRPTLTCKPLLKLLPSAFGFPCRLWFENVQGQHGLHSYIGPEADEMEPLAEETPKRTRRSRGGTSPPISAAALGGTPPSSMSAGPSVLALPMPCTPPPVASQRPLATVSPPTTEGGHISAGGGSPATYAADVSPSSVLGGFPMLPPIDNGGAEANEAKTTVSTTNHEPQGSFTVKATEAPSCVGEKSSSQKLAELRHYRAMRAAASVAQNNEDPVRSRGSDTTGATCTAVSGVNVGAKPFVPTGQSPLQGPASPLGETAAGGIPPPSVGINIGAMPYVPVPSDPMPPRGPPVSVGENCHQVQPPVQFSNFHPEIGPLFFDDGIPMVPNWHQQSSLCTTTEAPDDFVWTRKEPIDDGFDDFTEDEDDSDVSFVVTVQHRCYSKLYLSRGKTKYVLDKDRVIVKVDRGYHIGIVTDFYRAPTPDMTELFDLGELSGYVAGLATDAAINFYATYCRPFEKRMLEIVAYVMGDSREANVFRFEDCEFCLDHRKLVFFYNKIRKNVPGHLHRAPIIASLQSALKQTPYNVRLWFEERTKDSHQEMKMGEGELLTLNAPEELTTPPTPDATQGEEPTQPQPLLKGIPGSTQPLLKVIPDSTTDTDIGGMDTVDCGPLPEQWLHSVMKTALPSFDD